MSVNAFKVAELWRKVFQSSITVFQLNMRPGMSEQPLGDWQCTFPNFQGTTSDLGRGSLPAVGFFTASLLDLTYRTHLSAVFWSLFCKRCVNVVAE